MIKRRICGRRTGRGTSRPKSGAHSGLSRRKSRLLVDHKMSGLPAVWTSCDPLPFSLAEEGSDGGGNKRIPAVCQIVGYKNSGKTTLICALIPLLQRRGCSVAVIKHDAHDYDMDHPGTDTWQHRQAGASAIAITNATRTSIIEERGRSLSELIAEFSGYDYVLVEGFKQEISYPKLVMIHKEEDLQLLEETGSIVAAVVWESRMKEWGGLAGIRQFTVNDHAGITDFLWQQRNYFQNFNI